MDVKFIVLFQPFLCAVHIISSLSWYSSDWYYLPFPNPGTPTGNNTDGSLANVFLNCFCDVFNVVSSCMYFGLIVLFPFQKRWIQNQRHVEMLIILQWFFIFPLTLIHYAISLWATKILKVQCFSTSGRLVLLMN